MNGPIRVRAPATTANVGPGFDCVGIALDLWNEVEVVRGEGALDEDHLGVRAFRRVTSPGGWRFTWRDAIPRERGLGSSAAVIALGLVAGSLASGQKPHAEELLRLGLDLEGHGDNLAPALAGGVCLTWGTRLERIADRPPATAVAVVPNATLSTAAARAALPDAVPHRDAAHTAGRAALLGAALASRSADLFAQALDDRLHEPYRAESAPLLAAVRADLPPAALGATLSGSGPSVVVWARDDEAEACAQGLQARFPDAQVLPLAGASVGAAS